LSDASAIAAVTQTLQWLLQRHLAQAPDFDDTLVTARPLDTGRQKEKPNQLNLFLFQLQTSANWQSRSLPPVLGGEQPLALTLNYLLTAFGRHDDNERPFSHRLLGEAMRLLHEQPLLDSRAFALALASADGYATPQVERVRLTLKELPIDEIFKLWSGFQVPYRLSVVYEASVVLISARRRMPSPLPVLERHIAARNLLAPSLATVEFADGQPSARLGERFELSGRAFPGGATTVVFTHPEWADDRRVAPSEVSSTRIVAVLPNEPSDWPAGFYGVCVQFERRDDVRDGRPWRTNTISLPVAPELPDIPIVVTLSADASTVEIRLACRPKVWPAQRASLLLGDREVIAEPSAGASDALLFRVAHAVRGSFPVRLRVQGVDSLPRRLPQGSGAREEALEFVQAVIA